MDIFCNEFEFPMKTLQAINRVRCHLQIFSLADIATGDRTQIQNNFLLGKNDNISSIWDWPLEKPSVQDFKEWKSALVLLINELSLLKESS